MSKTIFREYETVTKLDYYGKPYQAVVAKTPKPRDNSAIAAGRKAESERLRAARIEHFRKTGKWPDENVDRKEEDI